MSALRPVLLTAVAVSALAGAAHAQTAGTAAADTDTIVVTGTLIAATGLIRPLGALVARIPDGIKGFGHVKEKNLVAARARWDVLMGQFSA